MKKGIIPITIVMLGLVLTACSTNTQRENTGIGAVTGAVVGGLAGSAIGGGAGKVVAIGAGAIIGALVGAEVGKSMQSSDSTKTYNALNSNATNQTTKWKNKNTGATYTVTPTTGRMTMNGNSNCREYRTTAVINGKKQQMYGTACRQTDGTWQAMSSS